jgi:hypothetical protein
VHNGKLAVAAFLALAAVWAAADDGPAPPAANPSPKPTRLTETVEKRLVQIDVAVEGDPAAIHAITAKDFVLYVGEREVRGLIVDHLCGDSPAGEPESKDTQPNEGPSSVASKTNRPRATFIFYFDQTHLTTLGRGGSLETARVLIDRLVVDGSKASIVSSASRLETIVPMTGDRRKLQAGLETLRTNLSQVDSYAATEDVRVAEISDAFRISPHTACLMAKGFAHDEWQAARRTTQWLGFTLGTLAEASVPKALVYFGDNLRQKAGLEYLEVCPHKGGLSRGITFDEVTGAEIVPSAAHEFDTVINEALARGVHFYTIQAEGLQFYLPEWDTMRHQLSQDALTRLAGATGGEAFLGGASNKYIANRIEALTSCRLLLSFPPGELPQDKALGVTLELRVPKVKIQTQGSIVVPSPASIERARLLAAFTDPASSDDGSLRALLIPRGGDGKTWKASLQLRLRPAGLPDNSAELGASIVRHDKVTDHFASSIATKSASRAIVLEKTLDFAPGKFAVVAVARDAKRGEIGSTRLDADWPSPAKSQAAIAPIAVLQTGRAAMSKDGVLQSSGSLARDVDETLDPSASVTLETVVCRGATTTAPVIVERWLEDGLSKDFAPMTIAQTDAPCLQTVDAVPAGRLKSGVVDYRVVARIGDEIVAQGRRTLRVGTAGER